MALLDYNTKSTSIPSLFKQYPERVFFPKKSGKLRKSGTCSCSQKTPIVKIAKSDKYKQRKHSNLNVGFCWFLPIHFKNTVKIQLKILS